MAHLMRGDLLDVAGLAEVTRSPRVEFDETVIYHAKGRTIHHTRARVPLEPAFRQDILAGSGGWREVAKAVAEIGHRCSRGAGAGTSSAAIHDPQRAARYRGPGRHSRVHVGLESCRRSR